MRSLYQVAQSFASAARERLADYVGYETPTGDHVALDRLADVLVTRYGELGGQATRLANPTGDHILARWEVGEDAFAELGDAGHILVLGHHDTVWPVGQLAGSMPYVDEGERIKGPGVFDMKGGLVAFETALAILDHAGTPLSREIRLVVAADEEIGSPSARPIVEEHLSGAVAVLGLEPPHPDGRLKTARYGSTRVRLAVAGVESHAALDTTRGVSAIDELVDQLVHVRELTAHDPAVLCNVGTIAGGGRTNVTAGQAHADIGLRFADGASERRVLTEIGALEALRAGAEVSATTLTSRPAWTSGSSDALLDRVADIGARLDQQIAGAPARGAADTNIAGAAGVPTLDGFGPLGRGAHAIDEQIIADTLAGRAALLAALLSSL